MQFCVSNCFGGKAWNNLTNFKHRIEVLTEMFLPIKVMDDQRFLSLKYSWKASWVSSGELVNSFLPDPIIKIEEKIKVVFLFLSLINNQIIVYFSNESKRGQDKWWVENFSQRGDGCGDNNNEVSCRRSQRLLRLNKIIWTMHIASSKQLIRFFR